MTRGTTSLWSGLILSALTAFGLSATLVAMQPRSAAVALPVLVVGTLLLWPFASGAHALAVRVVGVTPTPVLDGLVGERGLRDSAPRAFLGGLYALPVTLLSIVVILFLPYEVSSPEGVPFAGLAPGAVLVANLQVLAEEFVFRLVLFFPLVALLGARSVSRAGVPPWQVWIAILVTDVLFAWAHVGIAERIGMDPADYLVVSLVQKGLVAGTIFAFVAWRYGLEASIYCHYTANVLLVLIASLAGA